MDNSAGERIESDLTWPWSNKKGLDDGGCDIRLHKAPNASAVMKLLFEIKDHNILNKNGETPLHSYVRRTDKEKFNCLMAFLIHSKCDVNQPNREGRTALHLACEANDIQSAKALISFDAKINFTDTRHRKTALDIVESHHFDSDLNFLLILLGALLFQSMSGRLTEVPTAVTEDESKVRDSWVVVNRIASDGEGAENGHKDRPRSLESDPKSVKSPTLSSCGELPSLPEEAEEQDKSQSPAIKRYRTPDTSVEMGLTQVQVMMAKGSLGEDSASNLTLPSTTAVLEKTPFLNPPQAVSSNPTSSENGSSSSQGLEIGREKEAAGAANDLVEFIDNVDAGSLDKEGETSSRARAVTLPSQQVCFRGSPGRQARRLRGLNRQMSKKSQSEHNPRMAVLSSIMGEAVVPLQAECELKGVNALTVSGGELQISSVAGGGLKILSLDGGGIKGLIQIAMLKTIEQMTGKSIIDMFDWVIGTSIGGVLALGMIYGKLSLLDLRRLLFSMKDRVFKRQSKMLSHVCDTDAMEVLLQSAFGTEMRMSSVKKPNILITAVNKSTTKLPLVFFNNCLDNEYSDELVWKVARYTSAAPVFFAERDNYVDGGVKANNPTTFGLAEIQDFLSKKYGRGSPATKISCVVSLGCGIYPAEPIGNTDVGEALKTSKLHRVPKRLKELLTLLTTALTSSEELSRLCRITCEHQGIPYFRFSPEIGEDVGTTEKDNHKLCEIIVRAKQIFKENEEQVEAMIDQLGCKIEADYRYSI